MLPSSACSVTGLSIQIEHTVSRFRSPLAGSPPIVAFVIRNDLSPTSCRNWLSSARINHWDVGRRVGLANLGNDRPGQRKQLHDGIYAVTRGACPVRLSNPDYS